MRGDAWTWPRHRYDEVDTYRVDLADQLGASETASSVTAVDKVGMTVASITVTAAGLIEVNVTNGGNGSLNARVVTSDSRVISVPFQWRATWPGSRDAYGRGKNYGY